MSSPSNRQTKPRRASLLERLGEKVGAHKKHLQTPSHHAEDAASIFSGDTLTSQTSRQGKEKRESISARGPFRIEVDPVTGKGRCVENNDWPPGVQYKTPNRLNPSQGTGEWYKNRGTIGPGGSGDANAGPDPDWIPGLSEAEREELRKGKGGGWYVV